MKLQYDWAQDMLVVYGLQVPVEAADVSFNLASFLSILKNLLTLL